MLNFGMWIKKKDLQIDCIEYMDNFVENKYDIIYFATKYEDVPDTFKGRIERKLLGIKVGALDIIIIYKGVNYFIELRVKDDNGKKNRLSKKKKEFIQQLDNQGINWSIVCSLEEFINIIDLILDYKIEE